MRLKKLTLVSGIALALSLAGCGALSGNPGGATPSSSAASTASTPSPGSPSASARLSSNSVVGTVVRFSAGTESVDVTIGEDSPATRDLLSMLPLTVTLEEFNGREKIADLPRELNHEGSPGSDPEDGDLIYFTPWQNLGFYYNTAGIGHSEQTIHIGRYEATVEELARFEGQKTAVEIVDGP